MIGRVDLAHVPAADHTEELVSVYASPGRELSDEDVRGQPERSLSFHDLSRSPDRDLGAIRAESDVSLHRVPELVSERPVDEGEDGRLVQARSFH
jgi:hypothetical protein